MRESEGVSASECLRASGRERESEWESVSGRVSECE